LFLTQFHEIKKKEYETIQEFNQIFDGLVNMFPKDLKLHNAAILLQYTNDFEGQFHFELRDKSPNELTQTKEYAINIEENILSSKVDPFSTP
jgi:hypothetical protein